MKQQNTKKYWRSLEEFAGGDTFVQAQANEFSTPLPLGPEGGLEKVKVSRRSFLKLMGFGTAGVMAACSRVQPEKALPYVVQPEEIVPGKAFWYASTCGGCASGCGVLVKTREGRPIKIEGNPDSPISQGGLCAVGQSRVLDLYDSSRLQAPLMAGKKTSWQELDEALNQDLKNTTGPVRLISSSLLSPTTKNIIANYFENRPGYKHITYDAVSSSALIEAHEKSFGKRALPHYRFDAAKVIVSLGADFLGTWISPVEFTKQYSKNRKVSEKVGEQTLSRHFHFESVLSLTGSNADYRFAIKPSEEMWVTLGIFHHVLDFLGQASFVDLDKDLLGHHAPAARAAAKALVENKGASLLVSGSNDLNVQILVAKINHGLGNYGKTVSIAQHSNQRQGLDSEFETFVQEMEAGQIDAVIFYEANPVYNYPDSRRFQNALKKVKTVVALSERPDETTKQAQYVAPIPHDLESWNDAEPVAQVFQLTQPTIAPVYDSRAAGESLLKWFGNGGSYLQALKDEWAQNISPGIWNQTLKKGVTHKTISLSEPNFQDVVTRNFVNELQKEWALRNKTDWEVVLYQKLSLRDGKHAGNPWLQELPDAISKVTWDNYINMSLADAGQLGVNSGDVVRLELKNQVIELPVNLQPGQAFGSVSVALGYGREQAGKVGSGVGQNVFSLVDWQKTSRQYYRVGAHLTKTNRHQTLAQTQRHYSLEGRPIVKETTLNEFKKNPSAGNEDLKLLKKNLARGKNKTTKDPLDLVMLWEAHQDQSNSWGLAIDLNACTGCSACLIGCQSENNVPVVGKEEVARSREMHWLRIDRYYEGDTTENPDVVFQPMMCQHCGNAPCESVCPVAATVHSSDGLNQQVYNRCVGTRYCGNNCPYKVRRFNWFNYANNNNFDYNMNHPTSRLALNPDVVVRSRGVMEKCSMCVQRIQDERNTARSQDRKTNPENIKTACQQSCPADAIVFGDLNDENCHLVKLLNKNKHRRYHVLEELNVRPAVNYFTKVRNRA